VLFWLHGYGVTEKKAHPGTETSCPASVHSTYSLDNIQLYAELYFGIYGRGMFESAAHNRKLSIIFNSFTETI
jgi:hypothetical protein